MKTIFENSGIVVKEEVGNMAKLYINEEFITTFMRKEEAIFEAQLLVRILIESKTTLNELRENIYNILRKEF